MPVVDGYLWSSPGKIAGLQFKTIKDGKEILLEGKDPVINDNDSGTLKILWPLKSFDDTLKIIFTEQQIHISITKNNSINWFLDLNTGDKIQLPFKNISINKVDAIFEEMNYSLSAKKGSFSKPENGSTLRISPAENAIILKL